MRIQYTYEHSACVSPEVIMSDASVLSAVQEVQNGVLQEYDSVYASLHAPTDSAMRDRVRAVVAEKQKLSIHTMLLIGIGGSNMGFKAVYEALVSAGQIPVNAPRVYYADTVDTDYTNHFLLSLEQQLQDDKNVLIVIVSKSGTTIETVANAELFLAVLKQYKKDKWAEYVVAITDESSALWRASAEHNIATLAVPKFVGGRFSVFSAVGLFPLAMVGIDIDELTSGASSILSSCTSSDLAGNDAAVSAYIRAYHYRAGMPINDLFIFDVSCAAIGAWYRQLMGESIGKEFTVTGQRAEIGITPTVSIGSIDLHSVAQLYLGGPRDKFSMFLSVQEQTQKCVIPKTLMLKGCADIIAGLSFSTIMESIVQGVQAAYAKDKRPYSVMMIPSKSSFFMGQLLQWYMLEIIYLGLLLGVNPFDQPNVQAYKTETEQLLKKVKAE